MSTEQACNAALLQHKSSKGYWRRAKARKMLGRVDEAIKGKSLEPDRFRVHMYLYHPTDLRALIRLQPNNTEAIFELTTLLPPNPSLPYPTKDATAGGSSSSANADYLGLPKLKHPKALPFEAAGDDKQKLSISNLPLTVDIPSSLEFMAAATAAASRGGKTPSSGRKKKPKGSGPWGSNDMPMGPDTKKASGKGQTMSFTYPNWERYLVKKVTDQPPSK